MPKRVDKNSKEKIVNNLIEVFKKHGVLDNVDIVYNNKMISFGSAKMDLEDESEEIKYIYAEPTITLDKKPEDYNGKTIVVMYDGGALYSCWNGEYGWSWKDRLESDLEVVFGPYHLGVENIDHVSFTLYDGCKPEYESVMDKLRG
jgi:hypothetical protein